MIQIIAIAISVIIVLDTFVIIFFKTNGSVTKGHLALMFLGFLSLLVACNVVPSEMSFGKNVHIVFMEQTQRDLKALRTVVSQTTVAKPSIDELGG